MSENRANVNFEDEAAFIDPDTGWDVRMVERMVKTIQIAHEANPKSWALITAISKPGVPFLNIGGTNACSFYQLTVVRDQAMSIDSGFAESHDMGRSYKPGPNEGFMVVKFEQPEVPLVFPRFETAHESAVSQIVRFDSPRKGEHSDEMRRELERISGMEIPRPSYIRDIARLESPRYWKISPGSDSAYWAEFVNRGVIAVHWSDVKIPLSQLPAARGAFSSEAALKLSISPQGARSLWEFAHEMTIGDRILGYGNKTILGAGTITGDYFMAIDDFPYHHRRSVDWTTTDQRSIDDLDIDLQKKLMRRATIVELSASEFAAAAGELYRSEGTDVPTTLPNLSDQFSSNGLKYTPDQIATFYTALQTKGFVVLSGISGTGKSKIAQHFVGMLPVAATGASNQEIDMESVVAVSVKPYMRNHRRIVIPVKQEGTLPAIAPGKSLIVPLSLDGLTEPGRLSRREDTNSLYLYLRQGIGDRIAKLDVGEPLYLNPVIGEDEQDLRIDLFTDPGNLPASVRIPDSNDAPGNSLFLAVRPDWRDSTSLLGYYNPLTETYEWTEFLRFLLRAAESYRKEDGLAWFVILDEMNLAHVEYYFADLLSIIESGRDDDGWSQEPIRLTYPDAKTDNPPPHEIHLPPNLYIIGTVNMDETTHAFSPKVLDRAFTIELTEVDFSDYPPSPATIAPGLADDDRQALLAAFTRKGTFARIDKGDIREVVERHPEIRNWLQSLNVKLAEHQFQFGYRVFDEIAQFVHNAEENGMFAYASASGQDDWIRAFDHAVYMKVLPKFNGSHARLYGPLTALLAWAKNPNAAPGPTAAVEEESVEAPVFSAPTVRLHRVANRAERMLEFLEANGFVSFG